MEMSKRKFKIELAKKCTKNINLCQVSGQNYAYTIRAECEAEEMVYDDSDMSESGHI